MNQTVTAPKGVECDFALIMDDNSMIESGIRAGDIVYLAVCDHVKNGQIAAVLTHDYLYLRRVWQGTKALSLVPANTDYMTTILSGTEKDNAEIIGKIVAVLHMVEEDDTQGELK